MSSEYKKLISDGAVVVDFSATWCGKRLFLISVLIDAD